MILRISFSIIFIIFISALLWMFILSFKDYLTRTTYAYWERVIREFFIKKSFWSSLMSSIASWIGCLGFGYLLYIENHYVFCGILDILTLWDVIFYFRMNHFNNLFNKLKRNHKDMLLNQRLLRYESLTLFRVIIMFSIITYALL